MTRAVILAAVRTPFGRYGGALAGVRPDDLAAARGRARRSSGPGVVAGEIEDVLLGCANQAGEDNRNVARMAALLAGLPVAVAGVDGQPALRVRPEAIVGACHAVHRRRRRPLRRGRGRVDDAGAARDGQARRGRSRAATGAPRHDARLALR